MGLFRSGNHFAWLSSFHHQQAADHSSTQISGQRPQTSPSLGLKILTSDDTEPLKRGFVTDSRVGLVSRSSRAEVGLGVELVTQGSGHMSPVHRSGGGCVSHKTARCGRLVTIHVTCVGTPPWEASHLADQTCHAHEGAACG
jgi:hypothetical protein